MEKYFTIEIDDNKYLITDQIKDDKNEYAYLSNVKDVNDFFIRKIAVLDGEEVFIGLDSKEEFDYALKLFAEKHID